MNCKDIVKDFLIENGFDGLYREDGECACLLKDLAPCGEIQGDCFPGYKHPGDEDCDFYVCCTQYKQQEE